MDVLREKVSWVLSLTWQETMPICLTRTTCKNSPQSKLNLKSSSPPLPRLFELLVFEPPLIQLSGRINCRLRKGSDRKKNPRLRLSPSSNSELGWQKLATLGGPLLLKTWRIVIVWLCDKNWQERDFTTVLTLTRVLWGQKSAIETQFLGLATCQTKSSSTTSLWYKSSLFSTWFARRTRWAILSTTTSTNSTRKRERFRGSWSNCNRRYNRSLLPRMIVI